MISWSSAIPVVSAAFLGSIVEVVEAFTVILSAATIQGWRPAMAGTVAGLIAVTAIVALLGPMLDHLPLQWLQLAIGILLLLFGLRWLRKAILRYVGVIPPHDETAAFAKETSDLRRVAAQKRSRLRWIAGITAFKAVLLEGLEVIFIVLAVGAGRGLIWPAALGAAGAGALVFAVGCVLHRPLTKVPENSLKFAVGVLLSSFGVFWTGEGLGITWPGSEWAFVGFVVVFLLASLLSIRTTQRAMPEVVT
jgi:Ca2+/H+ antiporter, TMEM165/GDT1 family